MSTPKRILVATDFGDSSGGAIALGVDLAEKIDAALTILHAVEFPTYSYAFEPPIDLLTQLETGARAMLEKEVARARQSVPGANGVLRHGSPTDTILAFAAQDGSDLLVVGTHGRRGVPHWLLGSVAEKLVRLCPFPVLTVRGAGRAEGKGGAP